MSIATADERTRTPTIIVRWPALRAGAGAGQMNGKPTLADTLQAVESAVASAPLADLPMVLGLLEKVKAMGWGRLITESPHGKKEPAKESALLTAAQVAERLNVPKSFVYEAARQHQLKPVRLGKKYVRFTEDEVTEYQCQYVA